MSGRLLLPKNNLGTPDYKIGAWKDFSRDFSELPNKLEIPSTTQEHITSIPSPWARMMLFRDALNPNHRLHSKLFSELLDVLEIIFFKNSLKYTLSSKEIGLSINETSSEFKSIICDLNLETNNFKRIIIYYLEEKGVDKPILLAGSSPYSLFFTPEDKNPKIKRYFNNIRGISDRPEYFRKYLKQLFKTVQSAVNSGKSNLKALNDLLIDADNIEGSSMIKFNDVDMEILENCEEFTVECGIPIHSLKVDYVESALKIKSKEVKSNSPIVIKNNYRGIYYNNYLFPEEIKDLTAFTDREILPGEIIKYPWISPEEDFLEDHIIKVPYDTNDDVLILGRLSSVESRRSLRYLIPLKNRYFEFFDPSDVKNYLTIEENLGRVNITLRIPTEGNVDVEIKKSFFGSEQIIEAKQDDIPYLSFWPKIKPEQWKDKYFMIEYLSKPNTIMGFFDNNGDKIDIISPEMSDDKVNKKKAIIRQKKGVQTNTYSFNYFPDIIQLQIKQRDKLFKGLFILDKNNFSSITIDQNKKAIISFDFGTSNTIVGYQIIGINPRTSIFETKNISEKEKIFNYLDFVYLFSFPDEMNAQLNLFKNSLNYFFFPQYFCYNANINKNEANIPFSSLVSYDNSVHKNYIVLRANIPFYLSWASKELELIGDLKWLTSDIARELTQLYIGQLLLLTKLFLIKNGIENKNVTLIWSYPRSFSETQIENLKTSWESLLKGSHYQIKEIDESRASLTYFIKEHSFAPYKDTLKATIDIGGGTSDISIHKANQNILYTSALIGGNDLVGDKEDNSPIYKFLIKKAEHDRGSNLFFDRKFLEQVEFTEIPTLRIKFNYIIKKELKDEKLNDLICGDDFNFGRFILLYFYSILFYEIGLKLLKIDKSLYPEKFFFGGNGSRFLKWLNYGGWHEDNENIKFFNIILKGALGIANGKSFKIILSPEPKTEVAVGACYAVADTTETQNSDTSKYKILAENILLSEKKYRWDDPINSILGESTSSIDFTKMEILDFNNSNIYRFNKIFFDSVNSSKLIELNKEKIISASFSKIQKELLSKTTLDSLLRDNTHELFITTGGINVSLFILVAKGCLQQMLKIISNEMK